ncbi:hypothetical protein DFI02_110142 [Rhizobium sp. PP-F2F-G20b]|nr:hypothetical protein DFI02_110142 [Rhizobium sp. PP-F2F-G20b]
MTSRNELYKFLAKSIIKNDLLKNDGEAAMSSNGVMFIRIGAKVFKINVEEVDAISTHEQARLFMATQPFLYTAEDTRNNRDPNEPEAHPT